MEKEKQDILNELSYLRDRLEKLEQLFNLTDDPDETESLIYEEKAVMLRYSKALKEAKTVFSEKEEQWLK